LWCGPGRSQTCCASDTRVESGLKEARRTIDSVKDTLEIIGTGVKDAKRIIDSMPFEIRPLFTYIEANGEKSLMLKDIHINACLITQKEVCKTVVNDNGQSILHFIEDPGAGKIEIAHASPTYVRMRQIAQLLGRGYVYAATSKLKSYDTSVDDLNFNAFKRRIMESSQDGNIIASRLYYQVGDRIQDSTLADIKNALASNIACKYRVLDERTFDSRNDIAIVLSPRAHADIGSLMELGKSKFSNGNRPIVALRRENWRVVCVLRFELSAAIGGVNVSRIFIYGPDSNEGNTYVDEFDSEWVISQSGEQAISS
jgi:hypothetical protein